ncbi:energy transducer TonB family protein [Nitrospirillum iridis]|uniref:TonB family protein n=1 Tax=Nitrospirillum iridis TaxID=765888 RepID=A0A7X0B499_9PROT|nr:energy transducer TonB [Nitrospirillum iridis]MBB6254696.1 TonB family protein [Nitrospirillum iridis]
MGGKTAPSGTTPGVSDGFRPAAYGRAMRPRTGAVFAALLTLAIQATLVAWVARLPGAHRPGQERGVMVTARLLAPDRPVPRPDGAAPPRRPAPAPAPRFRRPAQPVRTPASAVPTMAPAAAETTAPSPPPDVVSDVPATIPALPSMSHAGPPPPDLIETYSRSVWLALARHRPPGIAAAGTVVLLISVAADGQVRQAMIQTSSGSDLLDGVALQAVMDTGRLPPPPEALLTGGQFTFTVPFRFR